MTSAGVAELADAGDLKSSALGASGFESRLRHFPRGKPISTPLLRRSSGAGHGMGHSAPAKEVGMDHDEPKRRCEALLVSLRGQLPREIRVADAR